MASSSARGLRLIKGIEHYLKTKPNHFDTSVIFNKIQLLSISEGQLRASFTVDSTMCNAVDTLHGGYISGLFDTIGMYGQIGLPDGKVSWTTSMHVLFLNFASMGDKILIESKPIKVGRHPIMETSLTNVTAGNTVAKATVCLSQGKDTFQKIAKDVYIFDVYEN